MNDVDALENKEIKGLSVKALVTLIISTVSIVATVLGTYNSLDRKIDDVRQQKISDDRVNEMKITNLEVQIKALEAQNKDLQQQINENRRYLNEK
jgi:hypothetical protein